MGIYRQRAPCSPSPRIIPPFSRRSEPPAAAAGQHSHSGTPESATATLHIHFQSALTERRRLTARSRPFASPHGPGPFPHSLSAPLGSARLGQLQARPRRARPFPHSPPAPPPPLLLHSAPPRPSAPRRAVPSPRHPPPPAGCSTSRPPAPRRSAPGPRWPPCQFRASLPSGLHLPGPGARGPR